MRDKTVAWLERAFQERDARMLNLKVDPLGSSLRNEPRFINLMKQMGLG